MDRRSRSWAAGDVGVGMGEGPGYKTGRLKGQRRLTGILEGRDCSCTVRPRPPQAAGLGFRMPRPSRAPTGLRFSREETWATAPPQEIQSPQGT